MILIENLDNLQKKMNVYKEKKLIKDSDIKYFYDNDPTDQKKQMAKLMSLVFVKSNDKKEVIRDYFDRYNEISKMKKKYNLKLKQLKELSLDKFNNFKKYIENLEKEIDKKVSKKSKFTAAEKQYKVLDENSEWIAIEPLTFEASCKFGSDTDWCTSKQKSYFSNYVTNTEKLVIFINKSKLKEYTKNKTPKEQRDPDYKLQAQIERVGIKVKDDIIGRDLVLLDINDGSSMKYETVEDVIKDSNIHQDKLFDTIDDVYNNFIGHFNIYNEDDKAQSLANLFESIVKPVFNKTTKRYDCESVELHELGLDEIPIPFGKIRDQFICYGNNLKSLKNGPTHVGGEYDCSENNLETLEWSPTEIEYDFNCKNNKITSLIGLPEKIGGDLNCGENKLLTSLEGSPKEVRGFFICYKTSITSLEGGPIEPSSGYYVNNNNLKTLKGAPKVVYGTFGCNDNQLTSLEYAPNVVNKFSCQNNKKQFTKEDVIKECSVLNNVITV